MLKYQQKQQQQKQQQESADNFEKGDKNGPTKMSKL